MVRTITRCQTMPASVDSLKVLGASFRRSLLAENRSPRTLQVYMDAVRLLDACLGAQSHRPDHGGIRLVHDCRQAA